MTIKQYIISFAAAALTAVLLTGCSGSDGDDLTPTNNNQKKEIAVSTNVTGMQTRATTYDNTAALQSEGDVLIDAYFHGTNTKYINGTKLHYNSSSWIFWDGSAQLHYYWPVEGSIYDPSSANITVSSLDFVGYCPYSTPSYITTGPTYDYSTGNITFTATMPTTVIDETSCMTLASQASMKEFMCAKAAAQTYTTQTAAGGAVPLQFKHPFALVKFVITSASGTHVKINNISISDLKTGGTCTFNGSTMSWASLSGSAPMKIVQELKIGATTETTPFLVIPNDYGTKYLTVNATWDDWSDVTISDYGTNVDFEWEPGHLYVYNLTLNKYGLKVDVQKYTEQW